MTRQYVPIYCLTKLTDAEQATYQTAIEASDSLVDPHWVMPDFKAWTGDGDGNFKDMYRLWKETGGNESCYHFAFFIDRKGVANKSIIIAQPDAYTMLYDEAASNWAQKNLKDYLDRKGRLEGKIPRTAPSGTYEAFLEPMAEDILGKRGLTYGRVPASAFRGIWCNLDIANMGMDECVELEGGTMEFVENPDFDVDGFMGKLEKVLQEEGQLE